MFKKGMKIAALALVLGSAITTAYADKTDYKDSGYKDVVVKRHLPATQLFLGYTFSHHYYRSTWMDSYRVITDSSPANNFSGIDFGLDQMLNDWLALHFKYSHYFRKGGNQNDGRQSGLTVAGLGFYGLNPDFYLLGLIGATVGAFSHKGDGGISTTNPSFNDADVNFAIGAGFQWQFADNFFIRPMINALPFQDRGDTSASLGFSIDLVYGLS